MAGVGIVWFGEALRSERPLAMVLALIGSISYAEPMCGIDRAVESITGVIV